MKKKWTKTTAITAATVLMVIALACAQGTETGEAPVEEKQEEPQLNQERLALDLTGRFPTTSEECANPEIADDLTACEDTGFAVIALYRDGTYSIDWSKWDQEQEGTTTYTVRRDKFMSRSNPTHADTGEPVEDERLHPTSHTPCLPWEENEGSGEFQWYCVPMDPGESDPPTDGRSRVETLEENKATTRVIHALLETDTRVGAPIIAVRRPERNPEGQDDRLTPEELADTTELRVDRYPVHRYRIAAHLEGGDEAEATVMIAAKAAGISQAP